MAPPPASPDRTVPWILVGLAAVFALMGCIFIAVGRYKTHRSEASRSWPSTEGVITASGWSDYRAPGESLPNRQASSTFHYTVNGHTYEYRRSGLLGGAATAPSPAGAPATVRVYYDPDDPADFRFDAERGQRFWAFEAVGAGCVLVTLPFWYLAMRLFARSRRTRPAT